MLRFLMCISMCFMVMTCAACSAAAPLSVAPSPWPIFWQHYTARFISPQGRVIDYEAGGVTTSEAQSYALFFALVANDKTLFSQLLDWTQDNLAQGSLAEHLPAWQWGKSKNGNWGVLEKNSASDADLWMAYTLIQAGRLWQEPRYTALGDLLARRIAMREVVTVPGVGVMLLPGKEGFHKNPDIYIFNLSYLPLPVVDALGKELPEGPWQQIARNLPTLMKDVAPKGFAPDWVSYTVGKGFGAAPEGTAGGYNAIRVYLWAGMTNPASPGSAGIIGALWGMRDYLSTHLLPPLTADAASGNVSGVGPVGFSAAVIPYLERLGMKTQVANQTLRLTADLDPKTGLYGNPPRYYDQNLILFVIGWKDGAFRFASDGDLEPRWQKAKN
ncbi:cellulose synthase complex periplasmic endoglucanase BcsZ [Acidithiobacillus ferrivorans]|nr:cellulose synthase complex periplasmic endoglucanase BcsZ [Acidithiobacillus ferrivorans]